MFPPNFDINIYKEYSDLKNMCSETLIRHYKEYGRDEGRICSKISNRKNLIEYIDTNKYQCLEIGPFDCPNLLGKVKYFDVLDQESLKKRAQNLNRNGIVPFINYVNSKGDLKIIKEKFDLVLSCHSIEHQLNFIQHLQDVSNILNNDGYYVIIVPDKRYCFDHFIKESTIADIIGQYFDNSNLHSLKSVIEHRSLTCHNDSIRHWNNDHGNQTYISNSNTIINSIKEYQNSKSKNKYLDVHALQFTPESFEIIINLLNELNYIDLIIDNIYSTLKNSNEFFIILKKVSK